MNMKWRYLAHRPWWSVTKFFERHTSNRVMKQFSLQQIVPPPFYGAFNREDRVLKATVDYSKKMKEGIKEWNGRKKSVLKGEVEVDSNRHSEEYFQWYRGITKLRIGRFEVMEGTTNLDLEQEHNHTQQDPGRSQSHPQTDFSAWLWWRLVILHPIY